MCGICGYTSSLGYEKDKQVIEKMKLYLHHRGPDEEGSFFSKECILGHRRLCIIDLESGHQPMANEDQTVWVIFNGEIYNYKNVWRELEDQGHRFSSNHSDTEVIVHGYEEWGTEVFGKLNGIFAIAIWDSKKKFIILARDHIGVKPLYYTLCSERVIFASEPKAILCHPEVTVEFNPEQMVNYFFFRAPVHPSTMYKGIYKLAPGSFLIWDHSKGSYKESNYWRPEARIDGHLKENECLQRVDEILSDAVKGQLISDVPLGVFLSGGVDSSLIAAKMIRAGAENVEGFVISIGGKQDEGYWSDKVANYLGIATHKLKISGMNFLNTLKQWTYFNDDPVSDPSALALLFLSRFAKDYGKKVMLSGEGGDELFAGYNSYLRFIALDAANKIPFGSNLLYIFMYLLRKGSYRDRDYILIKNERWRFLGTGHTSSIKLLSYILKEDLNPFQVILDSLEKYGENSGPPLSRACLFDQRLRLPDDILGRTDRATMAASLEARVPLLDYRLIELANTIPPKLLLKGLRLKNILKKVATRLLPKEAIYRKKMGFDLPIKRWLREELSDTLKHYVRKRNLPFVNYERMAILLDRFFRGQDEFVGFIWAYLLLEQWYDTWCSSNLPDPQFSKSFF